MISQKGGCCSTSLSQSHRQPLLFDAKYTKYTLTSKNSPPILRPLESNVLKKFIRNNFLEFVPTAKEVFLVRDFRDMLSSILAFNEKRGYQAFDRGKYSNTTDYVRGTLKPGVEMLEASWLERRNNAFLIKYEELILDPYAVLRDVFRYLEVDCSTQTIEKIIQASK